MDDKEGRISLKIDLTTGTIELDAPAESFNEAIEKTKELAETLDLQNRGGPVSAKSVTPAAPPTPAAMSSSIENQSTAPARSLRSKNGRSTGRAGRLGSYEPVPELLTDDQHMELREFFSEKAPSDQADRVLTAIVKGEMLLGRRGFVYNEIYTLMWLAGVKDLPKALDVVLGKMLQDQWITREGQGFAAKFIGRNRIENDLPRKDNS